MLESNSTALIRKASIEELCAHRNRTIELFATARQMIAAANDAAKLAAPSNAYVGGGWIGMSGHQRYGGVSAEEWRKGIDRACWRHLLEASSLGRIMGAKQRAQFEEVLESDPPEFTVETAYATFSDKAANADKIFAESVVHAFQSAPGDFKSNDAFKIGKRVILNRAYNDMSHGWTYSLARHLPAARDVIRDLDRIMHIMDGREHDQDATDIVADAMRNARGAGEAETRYFRIRWFVKGTAHVWFLRPDLVQRMNEILAGEYGLVLGDAA